MNVCSRQCICFLVLCVLILSPFYAFAKSLDKYCKEDLIADIYQELDLSPAQAEQLQNLRTTHREMATQFNTEIKAKKEELKEALQKQELDMEKVNQLHAELKVIINLREDNRLKKILEVRKILTHEQLIKFLEVKEKYHCRSESNK
ncbi:MAG: Spy/CpxP family protein refolding chaperone [bacterium]